MEFEAHGAGFELQFEGLWQAGVAFAEEADVHGHVVDGLEHFADVPGAGGAGGGIAASRWAGAAAKHGGDATHEGFFDLLGADEVDVGVDAASRENFAFTGDDFGAGADDDGDVWLGVGVAGFADGGNSTVLQADVGFDDAPPIEYQGVGDDGVHDGVIRPLALAHAIADDFAATEFYFVAVVGGVAFNLDPQFGVAQADSVTHCGAVHVGVGLSCYLHAVPRFCLGAWVTEA